MDWVSVEPEREFSARGRGVHGERVLCQEWGTRGERRARAVRLAYFRHEEVRVHVAVGSCPLRRLWGAME